MVEKKEGIESWDFPAPTSFQRAHASDSPSALPVALRVGNACPHRQEPRSPGHASRDSGGFCLEFSLKFVITFSVNQSIFFYLPLPASVKGILYPNNECTSNANIDTHHWYTRSTIWTFGYIRLVVQHELTLLYSEKIGDMLTYSWFTT